MKNKGGVGSGRKPVNGSERTRVPAGGMRLPNGPGARSGQRPSEMFPHGRNQDGSPKQPPSSNDPKPAPKK